MLKDKLVHTGRRRGSPSKEDRDTEGGQWAPRWRGGVLPSGWGSRGGAGSDVRGRPGPEGPERTLHYMCKSWAEFLSSPWDFMKLLLILMEMGINYSQVTDKELFSTTQE